MFFHKSYNLNKNRKNESYVNSIGGIFAGGLRKLCPPKVCQDPPFLVVWD